MNELIHLLKMANIPEASNKEDVAFPYSIFLEKKIRFSEKAQ